MVVINESPELTPSIQDNPCLPIEEELDIHNSAVIIDNETVFNQTDTVIDNKNTMIKTLTNYIRKKLANILPDNKIQSKNDKQ